MTPIELYRAVEGYQEANGIEDKTPEPVTPEELEELMERFPDG